MGNSVGQPLTLPRMLVRCAGALPAAANSAPKRGARWPYRGSRPSGRRNVLAVDRVEVDPARLAVGGNPVERRQIGATAGEAGLVQFPSPGTATGTPSIPKSGGTAATVPVAVRAADWKKFNRCG